MEYKIEKLSSNKVKINVTVPAEEYGKALKKSYEKNKEYFQVQGFRKGKAPYEMVKRRYGVESLYEDADNFALNDSYFKIVTDENIKIAGQPMIDIVSRAENEPFVYTAEVEVVPEFEVADYNGMEVERHEHPWDESLVDEELENMRKQNARIKTREEGEAVENGDTVNLDFKGFIDDVAFKGGEAAGHELEIGSGSFIGNFEEQLIGLKVGEEKDVIVSFPEKYGVEELNGKEATFKVKINDIKVKELPELDDDFASEVSEFETVEELRGDIKKKMKEDHDQHMEDAAKDAVLVTVAEKTELEVPEAIVESEIDNMLKDLEQKLMYQGMNLDTYYKMINMDEKAARESMKKDAAKRAKVNLVMEKLLAASDYQPSEEEIKAMAEKYQKQYNADEKFAERLLENNKEGLISDVKFHKILSDMVSKVKWVEGHHDHDHGHDHHHDHGHDHHHE